MKKLIAFLLSLVVGISSVSITAFALIKNEDAPYIVEGEANYVLGDANDDGDINAEDDVAIKKYNAKIGEVDASNSDIVFDGKINAKDLLALKRHFAGAPEDDLSNYYETDSYADVLKIAGNDISEYSIVYEPDCKYVENIFYSADTLRKYIVLATGNNLPIVTEAATEHVIRFVDVTEIEGLEEELHVENYKYEVVDGDLLIYGTRRGSMYAVYEIIEKYLGYRFYDEESVYRYDVRLEDIPEGTSESHYSAMNYRHCIQGFSSGNATKHYFPRRLNAAELYSYYEEAFGTLTGAHYGSAHSYGIYWQMATSRVDVNYAETGDGRGYELKLNSGEEMSMGGWNPCFTSDADYEILFRGLLECMRMMKSWGHIYRKDTSAFSFSINDNRVVCSCTDCKFIMMDGSTGRGENKKDRLNAGEIGLNLHLANRAARDIVEYYDGRAAGTAADGYDEDGNAAGYGEAIYDEYPDMKIYTISYSHEMPNENIMTDERYASIIPEENLILVWCSQPCNNHFICSNECGDQVNTLGVSQKDASAAVTAWGKVFKEAGAQLWYWYYPISYNTKISDTPSIFNIYYDFVYLVEECNVTGICHEGMQDNAQVYVFEHLKAHLSSMLMWSFEYDENGELHYMSFDEFCDTIKEYLKIYYGDGYEEMHRYIVMQDEAGNASGNCFVNNCDYPGDMYSYEYLRDNYEEMRALVVSALEKAETEEQKQNVEYILVNCEVMGLSACHKSWYLEGTDEQKAIYAERYAALLEYMKANNIEPGINCKIQEVELDLSKTPLVAFYNGATWRVELDEEWTKLPGKPSWVYG